jgi:hypothetical protein
MSKYDSRVLIYLTTGSVKKPKHHFMMQERALYTRLIRDARVRYPRTYYFNIRKRQLCTHNIIYRVTCYTIHPFTVNVFDGHGNTVRRVRSFTCGSRGGLRDCRRVPIPVLPMYRAVYTRVRYTLHTFILSIPVMPRHF